MLSDAHNLVPTPLARAQLIVPESFSVKDLAAPTDLDSWQTIELQEFALAERGLLRWLGRLKAVHTRRFGHALELLNLRLEHGEWMKFLKTIAISETTAWRARELYKRCPAEADLGNMTIMEAYRCFGIAAARAKLPQQDGQSPPAIPQQATDAVALEHTDETPPVPEAQRNGSGQTTRDQCDDSSGDAAGDDDDTDALNEEQRKGIEPSPKSALKTELKGLKLVVDLLTFYLRLIPKHQAAANQSNQWAWGIALPPEHGRVMDQLTELVEQLKALLCKEKCSAAEHGGGEDADVEK